MFRKILLGAVLLAGSVAANANVILNEGFDDITSLSASGWVQFNNSTPGGTTGWFQGNTGVFSADSGAADSYIAANFDNAPLGGNVDNWLITPVFHIDEGSLISFATRTADAGLGDNLQLLYSLGGTAASDFFSIGTLTSDVYPVDWTNLTLLSGISSDVRIAFRYLVKNTAVSGDYIGIDTFKVDVPEPGVLALFGVALLLMALTMRRRRAQI